MVNWKRYSVSEALVQLQDIPPDISGDDSCNSDDEQQTVEHDCCVEFDSSGSSDSEEEIIEPLRKRASLSGTKESVVELQSSVRRKCGKAKVDRDKSFAIAQEDMAIDECDEDQHQTETEKMEQFGKIKNNKKCENKKVYTKYFIRCSWTNKVFKGKSSQCL